MSTRLLLILDLPAEVIPTTGALQPRGAWQEPSALADAMLASLLTATATDRHGAINSMEPTPDGQALRPAPRHRLLQPPLWESVAGAIAVGLPWSRGSRGACVVTPEFVQCDGTAPGAPLPDRVWPDHWCRPLAALRLQPDELDPAALAGLGYAATPQAHAALAALISLHAIATALLEQQRPPLLIARFQLTAAPTQPAATARFLDAMLARYLALQAGASLQLLMRRHGRDTVDCSVHDSMPGAALDSALALGRELAAHFGLHPAGAVLPARHWDTVHARYQTAARGMPGMAGDLAALAARAQAALTALAPDR
ncbi:hypothetical protein [Azoarcus sp. DD4]|uniref:hypothetical protein n=1 Tax=Azoarcus sp. DD4 TaxID=2027405 RepID=UPI00112A619C|nr:hypothetical protein [Azoarcus sp. DD4]